MKKNVVQGKILDRNTGAGIQDLLVVLYDVDTENREFSDMGVEGPLVNDDDRIRPQAVDPSTTTGNITLDQANRPDARTWLDFPGDRLGSVLTNKQGHFSLNYSDDLFQLGEKERRPDLVLIVMGPDHSKGVSVLSRLLHYSYVPRNNAGRLESYIIYIGPPQSEDEEDKRLAKFFGRLNSASGNARREQDKKLRNKISSQVLPGFVTKNPRFVTPSASASEIESAVQAAISNGVAYLAGSSVPPATVHFDSEELRALGGAPATMFSASACDALKMKGLGTDLTRIRELISGIRAEQNRMSLSTELSESTLDSSTDGESLMPVIADTSDPQGFIAGRVLGQVASLPEISQGKSAGIIDDLQTIKDRINALEMSSGPANVTAVRDFHFLQAAFENVWTAALDGELQEDIQNLYNTVNALNDDYGGVFPNPDTIADLSEFEDFIASIDSDLMDEELRADSIPESVQNAYPSMTLTQWNQLNRDGQNRISQGVNSINADDHQTQAEKRWEFDELLREILDNPSYRTRIGRLQRLVLDLDSRLSTPYAFRYYKEYSVNYGILVNYRQEWRPKNYQVGRLLSTLPLAPGESRELKVNHRVKLTRAEKETRKSLAESSLESSSTVRSELDVLAKLSTDTNFKLSAQGSFSLGIGSIESSSEFSHNQKAESQRRHKQISESTRKAAEKVRQEREISIERTSESEFASESTQKIHNPNNEVTVTYLMYELERRYHVSQKLNRVTPVIMVALDMPSPHEITEGWILEHAWILRRVLLDDAFDGAITTIEDGRQSDSVDIAIKRATYERELVTLKNIERDLDAVLEDRRMMREQVIDLTQRKANHEAGEDGVAGDVKDFFLSGGLSLFGGGEPDQGEIYQASIEAAKSRLKYIEEQTEQLASQQRAAKRESREAGRSYSDALADLAQKDTVVKQLQLHIRQNIFHYMHAIWEMKHPDELFFQLAEQEVYYLGAGTATCTFAPLTPSPAPAIPGVNRGSHAFSIDCGPPTLPDFSTPAAIEALKRPLGSIAHIDQLLGFKGNYALFPLKDCTHITDYMMQEFVDDYLGVKDPATEVGVSSEELLDYARAAIDSGQLSPTEIEALNDLIVRSISSVHHNTDEVVLPTGQIYLEALKGEQALLEDFKLAHRGMDVLKVQEEIRDARMDALRKALRLVGTDPDLTDPDIDKKIVVEGGDDTIVSP